MTNTAKKPKIKDLDADSRAIYNLLWGPHGSPGLTWSEISEALQMSKQRIGAAFWELEIYGLAEPAVADPTDHQRNGCTRCRRRRTAAVSPTGSWPSRWRCI